jgi:hypothetical protein
MQTLKYFLTFTRLGPQIFHSHFQTPAIRLLNFEELSAVLLPPGVNQMCAVLLPPGVNQMCAVLLPSGVNQMCDVLLPPGVNQMCNVLLPPGVNQTVVKIFIRFIGS